MGFAPVYLPELFLVVDFHTNSILKNVLDVLLFCDLLAIFLTVDNLLEVLWMAPRDLNCSRRLGNMSENPLTQWVLVYCCKILLCCLLVKVVFIVLLLLFPCNVC